MKSRPSNVLIWVAIGVVSLIAFYILGAFLLQTKNQPPTIPDQDLETEQLP